MMRKIYVVTGIPSAEEILAALRGKLSVAMGVQKYVAEGCHGKYEPIWSEPLTMRMKPDMIANDAAIDEACVLTVSGKIVEICLPGAPTGGAASMELCGTNAMIMFDEAWHIGAIIDAHDYTPRLPRQVVAYPQLPILSRSDELLEGGELWLTGLPAELIARRELLTELAQHG